MLVPSITIDMNVYIRKCPLCQKDIDHKSERSCRQCDKEARLCGSCAAKKRIETNGCAAHFVQYTIKGANKGEQNPFFGQKHSAETIEKIKNRDKAFFQDQEYKDKVSKLTSGSNNPMYGKTCYQIWLSKYGKEVADEKLNEFKKKQKENSSGEKNPMYGRPSPQGSGNGWSGWYKDWHFRSLKELSYVINVLEPNNDNWQSAESLSIKIPYLDGNGANRNYTPDFLVNSSLLVEVKPTRLKSSISVRAKQAAAEIYVQKVGWTYVIIDPPTLAFAEIQALHQSEKIKFIKRYEDKFKLLEVGF